MEYWKQELYHHGILGMKWGKRNGPPYPLGSSDHSVSERKAGWRKSLGGGRNPESYAYKKKAAKQRRKDRDEKIQSRYDRTVKRIEKPYKRGQALSDKDYAREERADDRARNAWKKSEEQYKRDIKEAKLSQTDKEKLIRAGKIAAGVALTAIGTYAVYKAYQQYGIRKDVINTINSNLQEMKWRDERLNSLLGRDSISRRISTSKIDPRKAKKSLGDEIGRQKFFVKNLRKALNASDANQKLGKKNVAKFKEQLELFDRNANDAYEVADLMNLLDDASIRYFDMFNVFG